MPENPLVQSILDILTPMLGAAMARASVRVHCAKIGVNVESMTAADLPKISQRIEMGIVCFLGRDRAKGMAARIEGLAKPADAPASKTQSV